MMPGRSYPLGHPLSGWIAEAAPGGAIRLQRTPIGRWSRDGSGAVGLVGWGLMGGWVLVRLPLLLELRRNPRAEGLLPLLAIPVLLMFVGGIWPVARFFWALLGREEWWMGPGWLEVRTSLFGSSYTQRYEQAQLAV